MDNSQTHVIKDKQNTHTTQKTIKDVQH